jgi:hypothetical protein
MSTDINKGFGLHFRQLWEFPHPIPVLHIHFFRLEISETDNFFFLVFGDVDMNIICASALLRDT